MAKKKKKQGSNDPPGAPEWVVTFTDMISLLVTFFVLLMTFSSLDARDLLKVDSWLQGMSGVMQQEQRSLPETPEEDLIAATDLRRGAQTPHSRPPEMLAENLDEMGQKLDEDHIALDLNDVMDGLVLEFGPECSFAPGSVQPNRELAKSLAEIGRVLENYPYLVVVEGFTDAAFQPTPRYPSAEALSCARAVEAANVLLGNSSLSPKVVQVAGLGDLKPRADDGTAEGRQLNRRVQVRILSLSKLRATHLEAQRKAREQGYR